MFHAESNNLFHQSIKRMKNPALIETDDIATAYSFFQQGEFAQSNQICQHLLQNNNNDIDALNLAGIVADAQNKQLDAITYFKKAVALAPKNAQIFTNLATTLMDLNENSEAIRYLKRAIKADKYYAEAHYNLGNAYLKKNKTSDAKKALLNAIKYDKKHFKALNNLANIYETEDQLEIAKKYYKLSLTYNQNFSIALNGLGSIYIHQEKLDKAIECFSKALADGNEALPETLNSLGYAWFKLGNMANAEKYFLQSLSLTPDNVLPLNYLGLIHQENRAHQQSIESLEKALEISPDDTQLLNNLGHVTREVGQFTKSISLFEMAVNKNQNNDSIDRSMALNNLALTQLLTEDFKNGWDNHRFRPGVIEGNSSPFPDRDSLCLTDKKILWRKDQGIGDELLFLRFAPLLNSIAAKFSYRSSEKLYPLIKDLSCFENVYANDNIEDQYDYQFSIGDIAYLFEHRHAIDTPQPIKLTPDASTLTRIRQTLNQFGSPPYIGFTWQAGILKNNKRVGNYHKTIDIEYLINLLRPINGTLICLQVNANNEDLKYLSQQLNRPILDASPFHNQLEKMLCILQLIDEYFAVSNTYVHLRESLGKSSHIFVSNPPEWRWLSNIDKSYWQPNSKIYRQAIDGSWQDAIKHCKHTMQIID